MWASIKMSELLRTIEKIIETQAYYYENDREKLNTAIEKKQSFPSTAVPWNSAYMITEKAGLIHEL